MYKCECGREFENKQSYVAHCGHCKEHLGHEPKDRFGESRAWCRGLTKETDDRVRKIGEKVSISHTGCVGTPHTVEFKAKMSEIARYNAKNHLNGWKAGNNRLPNKYEKFTENYLIDHGIAYRREVVIPKSKLGDITGGYYQLDFIVNNMIDLEIDGSSHSTTYDSIRDSNVGKLYRVYRINHHDSIDILRDSLNVFLSVL